MTIPLSNQRKTATHSERADRVVAVFKTTMTVTIPPLSEKALHFLIVDALAAAAAQIEEERADENEEAAYRQLESDEANYE